MAFLELHSSCGQNTRMTPSAKVDFGVVSAAVRRRSRATGSTLHSNLRSAIPKSRAICARFLVRLQKAAWRFASRRSPKSAVSWTAPAERSDDGAFINRQTFQPSTGWVAALPRQGFAASREPCPSITSTRRRSPSTAPSARRRSSIGGSASFSIRPRAVRRDGVYRRRCRR
jgi:hypothetical protein